MANQEETNTATETMVNEEISKLEKSDEITEQESNKTEATNESDSESDPELDELVKSMEKELDYYAALSARQAEPKPFIIHKLHPRVKSVDPESYHPTVVSLGPYHHGESSLTGTESEKFKCLGSLLELRGEDKIDGVLAVLGNEEKMARNVYSEEVSMDGNSYLKMMALDSCYLLGQIFASGVKEGPEEEIKGERKLGKEIKGVRNLGKETKGERKSGKEIGDEETDILMPLLKEGRKEGATSVGPIPFYKPWCTPYVVRDLLLLENQIPFFVVEKIYESVEGEYTASALREKTVSFVKKLIHPYLKKFTEDDIYNKKPKEFHHLLHLCHMYFTPIQYHKEFDFEKVKGANDFMRHLTRWRRATQYEEVGIKVRSKKYDVKDPHSLLDVTFNNDVIEIPFLPIDGNTVSLFRNMVALEQMCPRYGNHFTAYVIFMSQIMCMPSDVTFMVQKGIIAHNLISDEHVSNQFASLTRSVVFDFSGKYYLKSMSWEVEERYQVVREKWLVRVGCNRMSNPWLTLAFWAGVIYVICTLAKTYFVVMSYLKTRYF